MNVSLFTVQIAQKCDTESIFGDFLLHISRDITEHPARKNKCVVEDTDKECADLWIVGGNSRLQRGRPLGERKGAQSGKVCRWDGPAGVGGAGEHDTCKACDVGGTKVFLFSGKFLSYAALVVVEVMYTAIAKWEAVSAGIHHKQQP